MDTRTSPDLGFGNGRVSFSFGEGWLYDGSDFGVGLTILRSLAPWSTEAWIVSVDIVGCGGV